MKTLKTRLGMLLRMSVAATLLTVGQQAMADGTDAGISITNSVDVDYEVNSVPQTTINVAAPSFVVDRIVTFTLQQVGSANTTVAPGETNAVTLFRLDNTGNSPLDFSLSAVNLVGTTGINGTDDNAQMDTTFEFLVANGDGAGGTPVAGDLPYVDGLPENEAVIIAVLADAPAGLSDGDIAHIALTATAAESGTTVTPDPGGSLGADLTQSATNGAGTIETVFNDAGNDGQETDNDGYTVVSATLAITKDASIIDDPVSAGPEYFAIPGAVVQYEIIITNNGSTSADGIEIEDALVGELIFYSTTPVTADIPSLPADWSGNVQIEENGTITYCTAEDDTDTNGDGCVFDTATSTLSVDGRDSTAATQPAVINVGTTDPVTIRFLATIDPS